MRGGANRRVCETLKAKTCPCAVLDKASVGPIAAIVKFSRYAVMRKNRVPDDGLDPHPCVPSLIGFPVTQRGFIEGTTPEHPLCSPVNAAIRISKISALGANALRYENPIETKRRADDVLATFCISSIM